MEYYHLGLAKRKAVRASHITQWQARHVLLHAALPGSASTGYTACLDDFQSLHVLRHTLGLTPIFRVNVRVK